MSKNRTLAIPVYDVVGIGFGPSNLALALAIAERGATNANHVSACFLERQPHFAWHSGMLIQDATMQVSFLKDLVTMRNPTSEFSFLNYLHDRGRLVDFINHKSLFPLRIEFHDYFDWCAGRVDGLVSYDQDVFAIDPVTGFDGTVDYFDVRTRGADGAVSVLRAANLVLGTGLRPSLPDGVRTGDRVWHNSELLHRVPELSRESAARFVVVGAGQSAAEVTAFLHDEFPRAQICSVFTRFGYSPSDDSSFANRIFDPAAVDAFYEAPEQTKQLLMDYHGNTNYSVVDVDLINELYRRVYREKVHGTQRLRMFNVSRAVEIAEHEQGVRLTVESLTGGERTALDADAVVYATGYLPADPTELLGGLAGYCRRDELGRLRVARDYRLDTDPAIAGGIYLQGGTEHSHGITSSLLSNTAVRVGEILDSIAAGSATANREHAYVGSGDSTP